MTQTEQLKMCSKAEMIKLTDIDGNDETFQTRRFGVLRSSVRNTALRQSEQEVEALAQEIITVTANNSDKRKRHLKPIIIFANPDESAKHPWIIVSGFHRYRAYLKYNSRQARDDAKKRSIPAQLFRGTEEQAIILSASFDTKPILPKHNEQKENAAWELVRTGNTAAANMSVRMLAASTGVSKSEVGRMRKAFAELQTTKAHVYENWKVQKAALSGKLQELQEQEMKMQIEKLARQLTDQIQTLAQGDSIIAAGVLNALSRRIFPHAEPEQHIGKGYEEAMHDQVENLDF